VTIFHPRKNANDFADLTSDPILDRIHELMGGVQEGAIGLTLNLRAYLRQTRPSVLKVWTIRKMTAEIRGEPLPPEPTFSLENMRKLLETKSYVVL
jgi:hypothetical protein